MCEICLKFTIKPLEWCHTRKIYEICSTLTAKPEHQQQSDVGNSSKLTTKTPEQRQQPFSRVYIVKGYALFLR